MDYPLVSALTPTFDRREFFSRAVRCFMAQDYPKLEWIILDDGNDPIKDLLPPDPRIKYFHALPKKHHGAKMNRCLELAEGEFGIAFDDDDWYPNDRITRQIKPMLENPALMVTGTSTLYYYKHGGRTAYRYTSLKSVGWLASIAIRRTAWELRKFDEIAAGSDYNFQKKTSAAARFDLYDPALVVASIHQANASRKSLGSEFKPEPWETIEKLWRTNGDLPD